MCVVTTKLGNVPAVSTCPTNFKSKSTVLKKLSSLKIDKSPGPDGIYPMFLNRTASVLAKPVTALFAKSYKEGTIPND